MAQERSNAVFSRIDGQQSLSDNLPRQMNANQRMERRADGSVWLTETCDTGKGPDRTEKRVDSRGDADLIAKGGTPWYEKFMLQATPDEVPEVLEVTPPKGKKNVR